MMDRGLLYRLRSERGTTLIEVIAAAVILVVIAGAVTSVLSAAQQESGQSRVIAIAGDLAQTEVEKLRSQGFGDLQKLVVTPETVPDVAAGGLKFTVKREGEWAMQGSSGAGGCTVAAKSPEALKISVSVTWASMTRKPVKVDTLVAAPPGSDAGKGNYIVQINRGDGTGVPGVTVSLSGATTLSGATDSTGCIRFNELPAGPYTVAFAHPGYVDVLHQNAVSASVTVNKGETGNKTFEYDQGGGVNVRFLKHTTATPVPAAIFTHTNVPVTGVLVAPANTDAVEPFPMFPHSSQYEVRAETCASAAAVGGVTVTRGQMDPPRTDLKLPQVRLQLNGLRDISGIDKSTLRARIQSPCGTVATGAAGLTGTLSPNQNNPTTWTTTSPVVTPPGTLKSVCIFARSTDGRWAWARGTDLQVGTTADETDADGRLYSSGLHFNINTAATQYALDAASACPAL